MAIKEGKTDSSSVSMSSEVLGSVIVSSSRTLSFSSSSTFPYNELARYDVNQLVNVNDPLFSGPFELTAPNSELIPDLKRDHLNALSYLEFDSQTGHYLTSEGIVNTHHFQYTTSVTVFVVARIRPYPFITERSRSPVHIGTLFKLGTANANLYLRGGETIDLQISTGLGTAQYQTEAVSGEWNAFGFVFGPNLKEPITVNTKIIHPEKTSGTSLEIKSAGKIQLGYHYQKGHLDADLAYLQVTKGSPFLYERKHTTSNPLRGRFESIAVSESLSESVVTGLVVRAGAASSTSLSESVATPTADPGDLPDVVSWFNAIDPSDLDFEDCDRLPTWVNRSYGENNETVYLASQSDRDLWPKFSEDFYGEGSAMVYPKEGVGVTSPENSGLEKREYTIFLAGRTENKGKVLFQVGYNGLRIRTRRSKSNWTKYDLVITGNACTSREREAVFFEALDRRDSFDLILRGSAPQNGPFELDVFLNGNEVLPDELNAPSEADPLKALINGDDVTITLEPSNITSGTAWGSMFLIAESLFLATEPRRTFKIQNDGPVRIGGQGVEETPWYQIAWYQQPLSDDGSSGLNEIWFLRNWFLARYG